MALSDLITSLRILANDTPTSNTIRQETPQGVLDGTNVNFRLQNFPLVVGSVYVTAGSTFRGQAGFTVDAPNGIITFGTAPLSTTKPWECDYNFQWFTDAEHTEFLGDGAELLGYTKSDPTTVPAGLITPMLKYALAAFWMRRSSQYAHRFASSGGQVGHSVDVVTKAFKALADQATKDGDNFRDAYWNRQGRKNAPASGTGSYSIDPGSPIR